MQAGLEKCVEQVASSTRQTLVGQICQNVSSSWLCVEKHQRTGLKMNEELFARGNHLCVKAKQKPDVRLLLFYQEIILAFPSVLKF